MENKTKKGNPHPKMDPRFVSDQPWELQLIAKKFSIEVEQVRDVKKKVGKSRIRIYKEIRDNAC